MIALKKILVATDFSDPSAAALAYGRELARRFDARLVVLHVVENTLTGAVAANGFVFADAGLQKTVDASGQRRVEDLVTVEDRILLHAQAVIVASNAPAAAIVEYAKDSGIDLVVIGTHGRGAVARLLMGSVAERVVRIAHCPVLTVHHPEPEFVMPEALVAVAVSR